MVVPFEQEKCLRSPSLVGFAVFASSYRKTNRTAKNGGKSPASILYKKNYNMPYAIFVAIICFWLTHTPENNWDLQDLTKEKNG